MRSTDDLKLQNPIPAGGRVFGPWRKNLGHFLSYMEEPKLVAPELGALTR